MERLAALGGPKTITRPFAAYTSIGVEEVEAARAVVASGVLSRFLGSWGPDFFGGEKVRGLEEAWRSYFGSRYAVSVNSNTSGLMAAVGAIGVEPGDEVIVTPWTMSASATSILVWNAIPVFADIEDDTFNLDPAAIEARITPLTRAIVVADIFGHPADLDGIMAVARRHGLRVIEDAAQAPGALYRGRYAGTVADIGVFSLNYHKQIHTGEGGMCVTDDPLLAERLQLIRNHAEAVVGDKGVTDLTNMIGFNFRMTEVGAAIGIEQLKKLKILADERGAAAERLSAGLRGLAGLRTPIVKPGCSHVYYVYPLLIDEVRTGVSRTRIVRALEAEGVPALGEGYANLHLLPMYQRKIAYGHKGFPWTGGLYRGDVSYEKGICPVAEDLHDRRCVLMELCAYRFTSDDIDLVVAAFQKVWAGLGALQATDALPGDR
jgi:perosamine synthetase